MAGHDPEPAQEATIARSGGIFNDFIIHDFDAVRWLTGQEVEEVYADGGVLGFPTFAKYEDVDTAVATLRLSGGTRAILSATRHDPLGYDIRTELFGSGDSVSIGLGPRTPLRSLEPGVPPPAGPAWSHFIDRFHDAYARRTLRSCAWHAARRRAPARRETGWRRRASRWPPRGRCASTGRSRSRGRLTSRLAQGTV